MAEPEKDALTLFLNFADAVQAHADRAHRPAYTETCPCGGSIEVSRDVPAAERRRLHGNFLGRHIRCTDRSTPPGSERGEGS